MKLLEMKTQYSTDFLQPTSNIKETKCIDSNNVNSQFKPTMSKSNLN
jgi:hypothetical protein